MPNVDPNSPMIGEPEQKVHSIHSSEFLMRVHYMGRQICSDLVGIVDWADNTYFSSITSISYLITFKEFAVYFNILHKFA